MNTKFESYMGFAAKSGNLCAGTNTCIYEMKKKKIKLLVIAGDVSDNTKDKITGAARSANVDFEIFETADNLSAMTGKPGKGVFGIKDNNFAGLIKNEIVNSRRCSSDNK